MDAGLATPAAEIFSPFVKHEEKKELGVMKQLGHGDVDEDGFERRRPGSRLLMMAEFLIISGVAIMIVVFCSLLPFHSGA